MKSKKTLLLVCAFLLSVALGLYAQEETTTQENIATTTTTTPTEVQTVSIKAKKEVFDATQTTLDTTIISRDEIEATGAVNAAEVLKYVSGITVRDSINNQVVQIRGARYEQTLLLVNGVRQSSAQNLFQDLAQFNTANIERIEIIKGAAATRYGANAAGGVINIITKDSVKDSGFGIEGGIRYGSYHSIYADVLGNVTYGANNQGNFFFSGSILTNARDYLIDDETDLGTFQAKVQDNELFEAALRVGNRYTFNDAGDNLNASFDYFYEDRNSSSGYYNYSYYDYETFTSVYSLGFPELSGYNYKTSKYSGAISYEHYSFEPFNFFVALSTLYQTVGNSGDAADIHNSFDNATTELSFSIQRLDQFGNGIFTFENIAEVLYRNEYFLVGETTLGTSTFADGDNAMRNTISIAYIPILGFLNYEGTDIARLTIAPGIRFDAIFDESNITGVENGDANFYEPTYSLGLMYKFDEGQRYLAKANFNTGYRLPTFNDLYTPYTYYEDYYYASSGNPDLKKESSLGGDIGFILRPIDMLQIEGAYFVAKYTDFIAWSYDEFYTSYPVNIDEYLTQGIDASVSLNIPINVIFSSVMLGANYTYLFQAEGSYTGSEDLFRMPFAPEHTASGVVSYVYHGDLAGIFKGRLNFLVNYSSDMFINYDNSTQLDGYYTFDITASMTFIKYITVEGGIRNLLDYRYDYVNNFQAPGREFYIALRGQF